MILKVPKKWKRNKTLVGNFPPLARYDSLGNMMANDGAIHAFDRLETSVALEQKQRHADLLVEGADVVAFYGLLLDLQFARAQSSESVDTGEQSNDIQTLQHTLLMPLHVGVPWVSGKLVTLRSAGWYTQPGVTMFQRPLYNGFNNLNGRAAQRAPKHNQWEWAGRKVVLPLLFSWGMDASATKHRERWTVGGFSHYSRSSCTRFKSGGAKGKYLETCSTYSIFDATKIVALWGGSR